MANQIRFKRASGSDPGASDLVLGEPAVRTDTGELFFKKDDGSVAKVSGGGISDGDKGDITVSNSGATFTIDNDVVSFAKMQNVNTSRILGRITSSSGNIEQLTAANVRTLINVADGANVGITDLVSDTSPQLGGDLQSNGNDIHLADNDHLYLGTDQDLNIYFDGTDSYFYTGAGTAFFRTSANEKLASFIADGAVELYHNNAKRFETSSDGVLISGRLTTNGDYNYLQGSSNSTSTLTLKKSASGADSIDYIQARDSSNALKFKIGGAGNAEFGSNVAVTGNITVTGTVDGVDIATRDGTAARKDGSDMGTATLRTDDADFIVQDTTDGVSNFIWRDHSDSKLYLGTSAAVVTARSHVNPSSDSTFDLGANGTRWANIYADTLYGDGSNLTGISAGATGGGSDEVFYENDQTVTTNYTITNGKNAMAAGPITINSGVTVTVGSGETLTIV